MKHQNIESLELKYHSSVNKLSYQDINYTVYENALVPEMYDHNFIYIHRLLNASQIEEIYEKYKRKNLQARKMYLNFFFTVNLQVENSAYENVLRNEYYEDETLLFLKLTQDPNQWKRYNDIEVVKVNTDNVLDEFLSLNFYEDSNISKSFAREKQVLNGYLYKNNLCDFYLGYYKGIPAASGEMFTFNDVGKLENLFVIESFRNKGIATELMRKMIDQSAETDFKDFYLATYQYDDPIKLYEKLGFIEVGKQKNITIFFD